MSSPRSSRISKKLCVTAKQIDDAQDVRVGDAGPLDVPLHQLEPLPGKGLLLGGETEGVLLPLQFASREIVRARKHSRFRLAVIIYRLTFGLVRVTLGIPTR